MKIDLSGPAFGPPNLTTPPGQLRVPVVALPATKIQVKGGCTGIWEVIRDDRFHGRFTGYRAAMEAAEAAAKAIIASGGAADIAFDPNGMMRTMEFRTGAVPIVR